MMRSNELSRSSQKLPLFVRSKLVDRSGMPSSGLRLEGNDTGDSDCLQAGGSPRLGGSRCGSEPTGSWYDLSRRSESPPKGPQSRRASSMRGSPVARPWRRYLAPDHQARREATERDSAPHGQEVTRWLRYTANAARRRSIRVGATITSSESMLWPTPATDFHPRGSGPGYRSRDRAPDSSDEEHERAAVGAPGLSPRSNLPLCAVLQPLDRKSGQPMINRQVSGNPAPTWHVETSIRN